MRTQVKDKDKERFLAVKGVVHTKLQETGDIERLRCYLRRRLAASGYKSEIMRELRAIVNDKGCSVVTVEGLYAMIADSDTPVDEQLMEEAFKKIKYTYKECISQDDNEETDSDSIGNNRYIEYPN